MNANLEQTFCVEAALLEPPETNTQQPGISPVLFIRMDDQKTKKVQGENKNML